MGGLGGRYGCARKISSPPGFETRTVPLIVSSGLNPISEINLYSRMLKMVLPELPLNRFVFKIKKFLLLDINL
jgi:hypothetical protein